MNMSRCATVCFWFKTTVCEIWKHLTLELPGGSIKKTPTFSINQCVYSESLIWNQFTTHIFLLIWVHTAFKTKALLLCIFEWFQLNLDVSLFSHSLIGFLPQHIWTQLCGIFLSVFDHNFSTLPIPFKKQSTALKCVSTVRSCTV